MGDFLSVRFGNERCELVPTQPRQNIGVPKALLQHGCGVYQRAISSLVAEGVVDLL